MALPGEHPKSRLIKKFNSLGPYLRETKCRNNLFFFDCLAVCLNTKPDPEKREFWGWWMELEAIEGSFIYSYQYGLYDKHGKWVIKNIKESKIRKAVEDTLDTFYPNLYFMLQELNFSLEPCPDFTGLALKEPT